MPHQRVAVYFGGNSRVCTLMVFIIYGKRGKAYFVVLERFVGRRVGLLSRLRVLTGDNPADREGYHRAYQFYDRKNVGPIA